MKPMVQRLRMTAMRVPENSHFFLTILNIIFMHKFLWCSAHTPTSEQISELNAQGEVVFLKDVDSSLQEKINNCPSDRQLLKNMAEAVSAICITLSEPSSVVTYKHDVTIVQLGGSPLFLYIAGEVMNKNNSKQKILFAHSERVSIDVPQPDGTVLKQSVFKHLGFI